MSDIAFTREEKDALVARLQRYFDDELSVELGQFDGEFLLDFISKEMCSVSSVATVPGEMLVERISPFDSLRMPSLITLTRRNTVRVIVRAMNEDFTAVLLFLAGI